MLRAMCSVALMLYADTNTMTAKQHRMNVKLSVHVTFVTEIR